MNRDFRELHKTIDFGFQAEAFLQSDVGKYLIAKAEAEVVEATEALKVVDPTVPDAIRVLQNRLYRGESIQYWLAEAIQSDLNAEQEFIDQSS